MIVYQLNMFEPFPKRKKFFDCICQLAKFVEKEVKNLNPCLKKSEYINSIKITRIDKEKLPEYRLLFKEKNGQEDAPGHQKNENSGEGCQKRQALSCDSCFEESGKEE